MKHKNNGKGYNDDLHKTVFNLYNSDYLARNLNS